MDANITGDAKHAFLYQNGAMSDLGTLDGAASFALSINGGGQSVGGAYTNGNAFIYQNGTMSNLNSLIPAGSGWSLDVATAVNDFGSVAGYGRNSSCQAHAFVLTPIVPEPTGAGLFACDALLLRRRRANQ